MRREQLSRIKIILYPLCILLVVFSGYQLWQDVRSTSEMKESYQALSEEYEKKGSDFEEMQGQLKELQKTYPEMVGWIKIPNTVINYPVMQTKEDNDFYLNHDYKGNEDGHGAPFMDVNCEIGKSDNLIIYGHHMQDGSMFQNLMNYKDPEFCVNNGEIIFDTSGKRTTYEVFCVMLISAEQAKDFTYYRCINFSNEAIFQGFMKRCSQYAIWQSEVLPEFGTSLLTLSTCEYSQKNGRLVVLAKQVTVRK